MARIEVQGKVGRIFFAGRGVEVVESWIANNGNSYDRKYAAFFENAPDLREGDQVTVTGFFTAAIEKWVDANGQPRLNKDGVQGQSIKLTISSAEVKLTSTQQLHQAQAARPAQQIDPAVIPF